MFLFLRKITNCQTLKLHVELYNNKENICKKINREMKYSKDSDFVLSSAEFPKTSEAKRKEIIGIALSSTVSEPSLRHRTIIKQLRFILSLKLNASVATGLLLSCAKVQLCNQTVQVHIKALPNHLGRFPSLSESIFFLKIGRGHLQIPHMVIAQMRQAACENTHHGLLEPRRV